MTKLKSQVQVTSIKRVLDLRKTTTEINFSVPQRDVNQLSFTFDGNNHTIGLQIKDGNIFFFNSLKV